MWLKPKEAEKHLMSDLPDSNTPVIFNISQTGFYRCNVSLLPRNFIAIFLVMETWVQLSDFPRVTVTRQYGDNTALVTQMRLLRDKVHI